MKQAGIPATLPLRHIGEVVRDGAGRLRPQFEGQPLQADEGGERHHDRGNVEPGDQPALDQSEGGGDG